MYGVQHVRVDVNNDLVVIESEIDPKLKNSKKPNLDQLTGVGFDTILGTSTIHDKLSSNTVFLKNQFLFAANTAFDRHLGFVLSPAQLYLLITQQIALHVNDHSEELRSMFVNHAGKIELVVDVPPYPTQDEWIEAIKGLRTQIADNTVSDTYSLFSLADFETATIAEQVAGEITLMDVCQSYFDYVCRTRCGIPYFILDGQLSDWELLREKAEQVISRKTLPELSSRWLPALLPALDKIIAAYQGERDVGFWNSFFKRGAINGSGGYTYISGWVNCFFPIQKDKKFNRFCEVYTGSEFYLSLGKQGSGRETHRPGRQAADGLDISHYPGGVAQVPVTWKRLGEVFNLKFAAGFVGWVEQANEIRPEVAWWIGIIKQ